MTAASCKQYVCINCTTTASAIYKRSDGNFIKLLDCCKCGQPVDRYIECEKSIIFTDLVLQDVAAYRHVLFNADNFSPPFYLKLALSLMLSEAYVRWTHFAEGLSVENGIRNNEVYLYIMCLVAALEIGVFGMVIYVYSSIRFWCSFYLMGILVAFVLVKIPEFSRQGLLIYNACLLGQCGRLANIAAIIWYQSSSQIFQALMLAFVYVSSIQSIRAALHIGRVESFIIIAVASIAGYSTAFIVQPSLIDTYQNYSEI